LDAESQVPPMRGQLNPRWVETLMGLPIGWVMPSCQSPVTIVTTNLECLETESYLPSQSEPSESYGRELLTPKSWLTPVVGDAHLSLTKPLSRYEGAERINTLLRQVSEEHDYSGQLNPRWVETLMGLPMGWVMPSSRLVVVVVQNNESTPQNNESTPQNNESTPQTKTNKTPKNKPQNQMDNGFMSLFEED